MKLRALLPSSILLAVVACSGASGTELFGPAASSEFGTEPGTTDDGSSGGSGQGSSGSSGDGAASSSSGASGGASSSSSSSSSGSSGDPEDAGNDAAPPSTTPSIYCGATGPGAKTSCTAGAEVCCGSRFGQGPPKYQCEAIGLVTCPAGTTIACDDRTDCPNGQVCCGTLQSNFGYTSVECRNTCNDIGGIRRVRFCDPNAATDECAAIGKTCGPSQSLPGYHVCRD